MLQTESISLPETENRITYEEASVRYSREVDERKLARTLNKPHQEYSQQVHNKRQEDIGDVNNKRQSYSKWRQAFIIADLKRMGFDF